jgi:hypothetical protein
MILELPKIRKLDREIETLGFQGLDGGLEIVLAFAGDADGVALNLGLHFHLQLLDELSDNLRLLGFESGLDLDGLAKAGVRCRLGFLIIERFHRDSALDHLLVQRFGQGAELHVVGGMERDRLLLRIPVDLGVRAFEIVALVDFLAGLIDRVIDLLLIDFGNDIERKLWHKKEPGLRGLREWIFNVIARRIERPEGVRFSSQ